MPETYPGIAFEEGGACSLCTQASATCRSYPGLDSLGERLRSLSRGKPYDCVVPLSGGKDSSYILYMAVKQLGLSVIAINYDSGYMSEEGASNVRSACGALDVKLVVVRPEYDIQEQQLRQILKVSGELGCFTRTCMNCEQMLRTAALKVATEYDVPAILWGSASAESAEPMEYEDYRFGRSGAAILTSKLETLKRLRLTPAKIARLLTPVLRYTALSCRQRIQMGVPLSCVLNPFRLMPFPASKPAVEHFFDYTSWNPLETTALLEEELGWRHPPDRQSRFDCRLYAFVEHRHLKQTGITDSGAIDCIFVREGKMTRERALEKECATQNRVERECAELVRSVGLKDLGIRMPAPQVAP